MTEKARALRQFVASEGRVHPKNWYGFYKLLLKTHPETPTPLILGGSIASDMAKRVQLLLQINHIADDKKVLDFADQFLRELKDSEWVHGSEPLSNRDSYGHEDIPSHFYLLAM
jgi:hypothetical protein